MPGKLFLTLLLVMQCLFAGCRNDFLGLFGSNDLSKRLEEKDNFVFLEPRGWLSPGLGDEYSFIVVADTHIEKENAYGFEKFKDVIAANNDIRFVVVAGDVTQRGDRKDVQKFIAVADSFGIPCYPVIGNHDVFFGNWPEWKELVGSTCYRINAGSATLLILDSVNAFFGKKQLDWLEDQLNSAAGKVFVFTHANLFMGKNNIQQVADVREVARITSMLSGRCDIMFMGHVHERIENTLGRVQYIAVESIRYNQIYCLVTVKNDDISYTFIKL